MLAIFFVTRVQVFRFNTPSTISVTTEANAKDNAKDRHQPIHKSEQILFIRLVALETITYPLE